MSTGTKPTVLIFAPSISGGLAEYIYCQAQALEKAGAKVTCLVAPSFLNGRPTGFETITCLGDPVSEGGPRLVKKFKMVWRIITSRWMLAR